MSVTDKLAPARCLEHACISLLACLYRTVPDFSLIPEAVNVVRLFAGAPFFLYAYARRGWLLRRAFLSLGYLHRIAFVHLGTERATRLALVL